MRRRTRRPHSQHKRKSKKGVRERPNRKQKGGAPPTSKPPELFRFHVLAVPHTVTKKAYSACPYTQNVLNFCKMMTERGHTVYHYGHADSEVKATEHVPITDNALLEKTYGTYDWKKELFKHAIGDLTQQTFVKRAIEEIGPRKKRGDFLLLFWGLGHADVAKAHPDLIAVEPGIGCFNTPSAPYNVFVSYAVMNYIYGQEKWHPKPLDSVIPNYFDVNDFTFGPRPGKYFMYLGRIIESKGIKTAVKIAEATGIPLKVAGQGNLEEVLGYAPAKGTVELVGYLEPAERNEMLKGALALLAPTEYNEPFACVVVEAMLCGTPVICSDWGGFSENILHGITGYRCRTLEQYVWAAENIGKIDRGACRKWAVDNFTLEAVGPMFEEYFVMIKDDFEGKGGQVKRDVPRTELNWLRREYPCTN